MATIHVDGKQFEVDGTDNLLQACLSLGLDIPYFCWHPALGSVGACRQCAVKQYANADDKRGRADVEEPASADAALEGLAEPGGGALCGHWRWHRLLDRSPELRGSHGCGGDS
mgnify:CR=1 FL=1